MALCGVVWLVWRDVVGVAWLVWRGWCGVVWLVWYASMRCCVVCIKWKKHEMVVMGSVAGNME